MNVLIRTGDRIKFKKSSAVKIVIPATWRKSAIIEVDSNATVYEGYAVTAGGRFAIVHYMDNGLQTAIDLCDVHVLEQKRN